jgi:hypothetical protein
MIGYLAGILGLSLLCAGWVALQFLARRQGTKNHFDDLQGGCGGCTCGGNGVCTKS